MRGQLVRLCVIPGMAERTAFFEHLPAWRNADALLAFSFDLTDEETARLDDLAMPVVHVSRHVDGRPSVYVDDVAGALHGARHLLNLGHRRIAYMGTVGACGFSFSSQERLVGYRQALAEAGLPLDDDLVVATPAGGKRGAAEAVGRLLVLRGPPTAVFAEQDEVAVAGDLDAACDTGRGARADVGRRLRRPAGRAVVRSDHGGPVAVADRREAGEPDLSLIDDPGADRERHLVLPAHVIPRTTTTPPPAPPAQAPTSFGLTEIRAARRGLCLDSARDEGAAA
ncbi:substrate-binding domain-containing protein [Streptomyces paradoxus]|uniref:substrate-binding domain-containing protein n=1 Tax=Streptomyces paradoxus TaxID=66375 RepID=UPI0036FF26DB